MSIRPAKVEGDAVYVSPDRTYVILLHSLNDSSDKIFSARPTSPAKEDEAKENTDVVSTLVTLGKKEIEKKTFYLLG